MPSDQTGAQPGGEAANEPAEPYRRLAEMDPPAMRSLIVELSRISDESSALATHRKSPAATARAGRDAQRAADAQAALASVEADRQSPSDVAVGEEAPS